MPGMFYPTDNLPVPDDENAEASLEESEMELSDLQRLLRELPEYNEVANSDDDTQS